MTVLPTDFVIENGILTKYTGSGENVVIPEGITAIGYMAFYNCSMLKNVRIPDSVTAIGDHAFAGCTGLADLVIPNSVTTIGRDAFNTCQSLSHLAIPDGVTAIGSSAFAYCSGLTTIRIPQGVTTIGNSAFAHCEGLTHLVLPDTITTIGNRAFQMCTGLTGLVIPDTVTAIGDRAFCRCSSLADIAIPEGITAIGDWAFSDCSQLTDLVLPSTVTAIGIYAFSHCSSLTNLVLPDSVTTIGDGAFTHCTGLTHLVIPESVSIIGKGAFSNCHCLTDVVIPGSVATLDIEIFQSISPRAAIQAPRIPFAGFTTTEEKYAAAHGFLLNPELYEDPEVGDAYKKYIISQRKRLLPFFFRLDLVQALVLYAETKKITVKNFETEYLEPAQQANATQCISWLMDWSNANVTSKAIRRMEEQELTRDPFSAGDMKKLWSWETLEDGSLIITSYKGTETEVRIPERIGKNPVTKVGDCAFATVNIKGTNKPHNRIDALQAIQTVTIPESVTAIGKEAFHGCRNLTCVDIPESVTAIDPMAFWQCRSLADENGFVIIRNVLYDYYGSGGEVTVPDNVTAICDYAFARSYDITGIRIPDSVQSIGKAAFCQCKNLKTVVIPGSVKHIDRQAFESCRNMKIHAPAGSYAETYAKKQHLPFTAM